MIALIKAICAIAVVLVFRIIETAAYVYIAYTIIRWIKSSKCRKKKPPG